MTDRRPPQAGERRKGDGPPADALRFTPPADGWTPPDEAGRAILRVVLAVKKRRDAGRKDAA